MSDTEENLAVEAQNTDDEAWIRRRRRRPADVITGLNLTAMMDVMTIILVYLIKLYASSPENITLNDDLRPPPSVAPDTVVPSVSLMVSKTAVLVDGKPVLDVENGHVTGTGKDRYVPLAEALNQRVEVIKAIHARGGTAFDGNIMLIADEGTPYELVYDVLYQAGKAQFTTYRLVVVHTK